MFRSVLNVIVNRMKFCTASAYILSINNFIEMKLRRNLGLDADIALNVYVIKIPNCIASC